MMKKTVYTVRRSPMAKMVAVLVVFIGLFELGMMSGILMLRADTVERVAPWAYESFLKLTGEHPDFRPEWSVLRSGEPLPEDKITLAGLIPSALPSIQSPETNEVMEVVDVQEVISAAESEVDLPEEPIPPAVVLEPITEESPAKELPEEGEIEDIDGDEPVG